MSHTAPDPRTDRDPSSERPISADIASDPVCGRDVDPNASRFQAEHLGRSYTFCSDLCQQKFEFHPEKYL